MKVASLIVTSLAVVAAIAGTRIADHVDDPKLVAALQNQVGSHADSLKQVADRRGRCVRGTRTEVRTTRNVATELLDVVERDDPADIDLDRLEKSLAGFLKSAKGLKDDRDTWQKVLDEFEEQADGKVFAEWESILKQIQDPKLKRYHESLLSKYRKKAELETKRLRETVSSLDQSLARAEDVGRALKSLQLAQQARDLSGEVARTADAAAAKVREFVSETDRVLKLLGG